MHFDYEANVLHLFSVGGHMSSYVNCLGGRGPHMPLFIGGHMSGGGGGMSYTLCGILSKAFAKSKQFIGKETEISSYVSKRNAVSLYVIGIKLGLARMFSKRACEYRF